MLILGIETSCDETAVAVYDTSLGRIAAERVASQIETHARFGGVVPEIASREHLAVLPGMVDTVLEQAGHGWADIGQIAVTAGPGLMGALLVGVSYARAAGAVNSIPVVPVHHMEGHLFAAGLSGALPPFPFITLLVSGGHTMLVRVDGLGRYEVVGQTIDDAAGECFDKSARVLGLPYPGGPAISGLAAKGDAGRFKLPRPLLNRDNLDFSFSGLKTAVMYKAKELGEMSDQDRCDLAAAVELAIADVLVKKSIRACLQQDVSRLVIAGGVAANNTLRTLLEREATREKVAITLPELSYCTDNAAMIAYAASLRISEAPVESWDVRARWPLADIGVSG